MAYKSMAETNGGGVGGSLKEVGPSSQSVGEYNLPNPGASSTWRMDPHLGST